MNRFEAIGNLTKDIEVRTTPSNKEVATFSIGVKRTFKNSEGNYDSDFFNYIMWQPNEFYKEYLKKGVKVYVSARLNNRTYENEKNEKRRITDYIVEHLEILSKIEKEEKQETLEEIGVPDNFKTEYDNEKSVHLDDDSLPF